MSFFRPYYDICIVNKLNKMEYTQARNIGNIFSVNVVVDVVPSVPLKYCETK
jgi:hypothetical protein